MRPIAFGCGVNRKYLDQRSGVARRRERWRVRGSGAGPCRLRPGPRPARAGIAFRRSPTGWLRSWRVRRAQPELVLEPHEQLDPLRLPIPQIALSEASSTTLRPAPPRPRRDDAPPRARVLRHPRGGLPCPLGLQPRCQRTTSCSRVGVVSLRECGTSAPGEDADRSATLIPHVRRRGHWASASPRAARPRARGVTGRPAASGGAPRGRRRCRGAAARAPRVRILASRRARPASRRPSERVLGASNTQLSQAAT